MSQDSVRELMAVTVDRKRVQSAVVTTNELYHCEELEEDATSVYDDIEETCDNVYVNEIVTYLEVLPDEMEECDSESKPEPPGLRSDTEVTKSQDQNHVHGYEALKEKKPDHVYLHVSNDETDGLGHDIEAQENQAQDQDTYSQYQAQDQENIKPQDHV